MVLRYVAAAIAMLSVFSLANVVGMGKRATASPAVQGRSASTQEEIKNRATELYSAWQRGDAATVWDLLSDEQKSFSKREAYIASVRQYFQGLRLVEFQIANVEPKSGNTAVVSAKLVVETSPDKQKTDAAEQTNWVLQATDRKWYYAGVIGKAAATVAIREEIQQRN